MKKSILFFLFGMAIISVALGQDNKGLELKIEGQVMTDVGYNFMQINPDYYDVMRPTQLPAYKNQYGTDGNIYFSVRQSMLGIRTSYPTRLGEIKARFAFDLFG